MNSTDLKTDDVQAHTPVSNFPLPKKTDELLEELGYAPLSRSNKKLVKLPSNNTKLEIKPLRLNEFLPYLKQLEKSDRKKNTRRKINLPAPPNNIRKSLTKKTNATNTNFRKSTFLKPTFAYSPIGRPKKLFNTPLSGIKPLTLNTSAKSSKIPSFHPNARTDLRKSFKFPEPATSKMPVKTVNKKASATITSTTIKQQSDVDKLENFLLKLEQKVMNRLDKLEENIKYQTCNCNNKLNSIKTTNENRISKLVTNVLDTTQKQDNSLGSNSKVPINSLIQNTSEQNEGTPAENKIMSPLCSKTPISFASIDLNLLTPDVTRAYKEIQKKLISRSTATRECTLQKTAENDSEQKEKSPLEIKSNSNEQTPDVKSECNKLKNKKVVNNCTLQETVKNAGTPVSNSYNEMRNYVPYLQTPRLRKNCEPGITPSVQKDNDAFISKRLQDQLKLLSEKV